MAAPFLDATAFAAMFRPLRAAEIAVATPLLQAVSDWIRDKKPDIAADDPAAILVCFQVVRHELMYGKYAGLTDFAETVGRRSMSGSISAADVDQYITDAHRTMLGISIHARPRYSFKRGDY